MTMAGVPHRLTDTVFLQDRAIYLCHCVSTVSNLRRHGLSHRHVAIRIGPGTDYLIMCIENRPRLRHNNNQSGSVIV